jgi:hypothetical protein
MVTLISIVRKVMTAVRTAEIEYECFSFVTKAVYGLLERKEEHIYRLCAVNFAPTSINKPDSSSP